ncbi:hypothetical protein [Bifidobacterium merycicum]|uniref:hypothetical protein n=1 Tax=Bifidobacterium merycicum TaxID=78345 RepID=UPI0011606295|nr:hypothetical protein [Bifidobacterium merycicum]
MGKDKEEKTERGRTEEREKKDGARKGWRVQGEDREKTGRRRTEGIDGRGREREKWGRTERTGRRQEENRGKEDIGQRGTKEGIDREGTEKGKKKNLKRKSPHAVH